MGAKAGLRRFVVVRPDDQQAVGPGNGGFFREDDAFAGRIVARADDHRHAPVGVFEGDRDEAAAFVGPDRSVLAGGPEHHQTLDADVDLAVDEAAEGSFVYGSISGEGGHQRGGCSSE